MSSRPTLQLPSLYVACSLWKGPVTKLCCRAGAPSMNLA